MARGIANLEPRRLVSASELPTNIILFNESGATIFYAKQRENIVEAGLPVPTMNQKELLLWQGELWVGADVDGSAYRWIRTSPNPPLVAPDEPLPETPGKEVFTFPLLLNPEEEQKFTFTAFRQSAKTEFASLRDSFKKLFKGGDDAETNP